MADGVEDPAHSEISAREGERYAYRAGHASVQGINETLIHCYGLADWKSLLAFMARRGRSFLTVF